MVGALWPLTEESEMWKGREPWIFWGLNIFMAIVSVTITMSWSSASSRYAVSLGGNGEQVGMDSSAELRTPIMRVGHSVGVDAVAFGPNGSLVAGGNVDNLVRIWQMQTGKIWRTLKG